MGLRVAEGASEVGAAVGNGVDVGGDAYGFEGTFSCLILRVGFVALRTLLEHVDVGFGQLEMGALMG